MAPHSGETPLSFDLVISSMTAANHKQMVKYIAGEISTLIGIHERIVAERLFEKERDQPSSIGEGVSITHLPISGLQNPTNLFIRLKAPINMNAPDHKGVDLVCVLLTPEREGTSYLRGLARLSRLFKNPQTCVRLRAATDEKSLRQILEQTTAQSLAA
jgi:nitrogen PTS system EIIA component